MASTITYALVLVVLWLIFFGGWKFVSYLKEKRQEEQEELPLE